MNATEQGNTSPASPSQLGAQLKPLVSDLGEHRAGIYWADFLATVSAFWLAFAWTQNTSTALTTRWAAGVVAVFALYRAAAFMHELAHVPSGRLPGFRWAWNLLCGIPTLLPSYLYRSHQNHHATRLYATVNDPEYLEFDARPTKSWWTLIAGTVVSPVLLGLRFGVLVPLAWLSPAVRRWLDVHFSAVVIHPGYKEPFPRSERKLSERRLVEPLTTIYYWLVVVACVTGALAMRTVISFLACATCALLINAIRTRYAHRYACSGDGVDHAAQVADSRTHDHGAWFALFAPVGLRFHALHHLFPHLPYHHLKTAHSRILQSPLPAAELYRSTCRNHPHPVRLVAVNER